METSIQVTDVSKVFYIFEKDYRIIPWLFTHKGHSGQRIALDHISFEIKKGEVVALIGKNGAGKSTLMKIVAGITYPTAGEVMVNGSVGSLINLSAGFNGGMTGRQNIYHKGMLLGKTPQQIDDILDDIIDFVDIGEYFDLPLRMYSSGMSARLGFALAVFSNPDILIIDEVFAVGDKAFQDKSKAKTTELFKAGKSILFASHSDQLIRSFCHRALYIRDSRIVFSGSVDEALALYEQDRNAR